MEKSDVKLIQFNGKNYPAWAFQFQLYLEAKELWGLVSGSDPRPTEDDKKICTWNTKDAKIKTWILGAVEPHLILNLKPIQPPRRCGVTYRQFIIKIILHASFNLSVKLHNTVKAPCPFRTTILVSAICGVNMMGLNMLPFQTIFLKLYKTFKPQVTGTSC